MIRTRFENTGLASFLMELIYEYVPKKVVNLIEIGVAEGRTPRVLHYELKGKELHFHGVDPYNKYRASDHSMYQKHENAKQSALNIMKLSPYFGLIEDISTEAVKSFSGNFADIIFIDAMHDYEHVKQDLEVWYPILVPNGVMAGHDFRIMQGTYKLFGGVDMAVYEFADKMGEMVQEDFLTNCFYFVKKERRG